MNKFLKLIKSILLWGGLLYWWFLYSYRNLDKSEAAYQYTYNSGPVPSGYSFFILGIILAFLLRKKVFSLKKSIGSILVKIFVALIIIIGLYLQISYDFDLSKLREYKNYQIELTR